MAKNNSVVAIIVAAGEGCRMGSVEKKQYMLLGGLPVLSRTLSSFDICDAVQEIFLVIPEGDRHFCQHEILDPMEIHKPVHMVTGGSTRQESVLNGLKATKGRFQHVVIHDGVRPLVKPEKISRCIDGAEKHGACILAVPTTDTVKEIDEKKNTVVSTLNRTMLRMAQTPQAFCYRDIVEAHLLAQRNNYVGTDDAELVEKTGAKVKVISGDPYNIKITTLEDLKLAQALLATEVEGQRRNNSVTVR